MSRPKIKLSASLITSLLPPVLLLVLYLVVAFLLRGVLPTGSEVLDDLAKLIKSYGYQIVFLGAFLEAALIIDIFVPGTSAVLVGAYFTSTGLLSYPTFFMVVASGFFLGYLLDYAIGYYGWSNILRKFGLGKQLDGIKRKIERVGGKSFFLGFWHPDLASIFAVAAGTIKMNLGYYAFYSLLAGSIWLLFWTGLVYLLGLQIYHLLSGQAWVSFIFVPVIFLVLRWLKKD